MKILSMFIVLGLAAPATIALAADSATTNTKTINAAGTSVTTESSNKGSTTSSGVKKSIETEKTVVNPKGLMNEKTAKLVTEGQTEPNGDFANSKTITHADGTVEVLAAEKSTSENWLNKGKTTTTTTARSVDPKGLGNKTTTTVEETVDTNPDGTEDKTVVTREN